MRMSIWRSVFLVGAVVMSAVGVAGFGTVVASESAAASTPPQAQAIINAAEKWVTSPVTPYCWEGGTTTQPSHGTGDSGTENGQPVYSGPAGDSGCANSGPTATAQGFDCTGLTLYAVYQALGITLPHDSTQATAAVADGGQELTSISSLLPGDLVYFGGSFGDFVHVGIVASGSGSTSKIVNAYDFENDGDNGRNNKYWGVAIMPVSWWTSVPGFAFVGGVRLWAAKPGLPTVSGFTASSSTLTSSGGTVILSADVTNATSCVFSSKPAVSGLQVTVGCSNGAVSDAPTVPANTGKKPVQYTFSLSIVGSKTVKAKPVTVVESPGGTISKLVIYQADSAGGLCQTTVVATGKNLLPAPTGGVPAPVSGTDYPNVQLAFVDNTSVPTPWSFGNLADGWDQNLIGLTVTKYSNTSMTFSFVNSDGYTAPQPGDEVYVSVRNSSTGFVAKITGPVPVACILPG
jgi:cell wall-associated NlpC family hydrolase